MLLTVRHVIITCFAGLCTLKALFSISLPEIQLSLSNNRPSAALQQLDEYLADNPNDYQARKLRFHACQQLGLIEKARNELRALLRYSQNEENLLTAARFYFNMEELETCQQYCSRILSGNSRNKDALILLAQTWDTMGFAEKAQDFFTRASYISPNDYELLYQLSLFHIRHGHAQNEQTIQTFARYYPESPDLLYLQALHGLNSGKPAAALEQIKRALYYRPGYSLYISLLINILEEVNQLETAARLLENETQKLGIPNTEYRLAWLKHQSSYPDSYIISDRQYLEHIIWPHLKNSLKNAEDVEAAWLYLDLLTEKNYTLNHERRRKAAGRHYTSAQQAWQAGDSPLFHWEMLQCLLFNPQNIEYRLRYAQWLREQNYQVSYLEELTITDRLYESSNFVIATKLERTKRTQARSLSARLNISPLEIPRQRNHLLLCLPFQAESTYTPNAADLLTTLLSRRLSMDSRMRFTATNTFSGLDPVLTRVQPNYYLRCAIKATQTTLAGHFYLYTMSNRALILEKRYITGGNSKYRDLILTASRDIVDFIQIQASIITIESGKPIIAAGLRDGIESGDVFMLKQPASDSYRTNHLLQVTDVEEFICRTIPSHPLILSYINLGDLLIKTGNISNTLSNSADAEE
jgi:Tfp pilus assembly protein PilF